MILYGIIGIAAIIIVSMYLNQQQAQEKCNSDITILRDVIDKQEREINQLDELLQNTVSPKMAVCPDEWFINNQPDQCNKSVENCKGEQYFIINGFRYESREINIDWVEENCNVTSKVVS
jgi:hypothetical protein